MFVFQHTGQYKNIQELSGQHRAVQSIRSAKVWVTDQVTTDQDQKSLSPLKSMEHFPVALSQFLTLYIKHLFQKFT